ncbi:MAG: pyruvate kinase, partial [Candidatus Eremiobacteraeota bacterium]|nr:pyruvate kinase [Candidatus Eremiobacteraeota bacterium]
MVEPILKKRTKIVATVGPASRDPAILRSLFISGANVLRLNFSHGTPEDHGAVLESARVISTELGIHTAILQDLPGPKVRTGPLADGAASVRLERGDRFVITSEQVAGTAQRVSTN